MSHTIVFDKKVAAIRTRQGNLIYALLFKTADNNLHPIRPEWDCYRLCTQDEIIDLVLSLSTLCESGAWKSQRGTIKPENFIDSMFKEFKNPHPISVDSVIRLSVGNDYSSTWIANDDGLSATWNKVQNQLPDAFKKEWIEKLNSHEIVELSLHEHGEIIAQISKNAQWKFYKYINWMSIPDDSLGYSREKIAGPDIENPVYTKIQGTHYVIREDGTYRHVGYAHEAFNDFSSNFLADFEKKYPGNYKKSIHGFRVSINKAKAMSGEWKVEIPMFAINDGSWAIKELLKIHPIADLPKKHDGSPYLLLNLDHESSTQALSYIRFIDSAIFTPLNDKADDASGSDIQSDQLELFSIS